MVYSCMCESFHNSLSIQHVLALKMMSIIYEMIKRVIVLLCLKDIDILNLSIKSFNVMF